MCDGDIPCSEVKYRDECTAVKSAISSKHEVEEILLLSFSAQLIKLVRNKVWGPAQKDSEYSETNLGLDFFGELETFSWKTVAYYTRASSTLAI